ncbi:hypothetical protein GYMLUDRAFT_49305 [Collybiopsis luxurians FD-317 M1]|uniref:Unplaced genomic scaffold GYMLUscaffold_80, whole genome shotgun sequence n=1 Tax=Collybiopsis luxurians FD-317 M1 TaxID=944289 RepID=A0A0D0CF18_9AGAR|nr:hypothetical protein GYMLUDRAFT_49305 [Collybiopsis luxurians FD-317 M1]
MNRGLDIKCGLLTDKLSKRYNYLSPRDSHWIPSGFKSTVADVSSVPLRPRRGQIGCIMSFTYIWIVLRKAFRDIGY